MKYRLDSDKVLSVSAIVVSLGTLFLIFYQTNLIRQEQKASVMPSLLIGYSVKANSEQIQLRNQGLGPAFIRDVKVRYMDTIYEADPFNFLLQVYPEREEITNTVNSFDLIFPGRIIPNDELIVMYRKYDRDSTQLLGNIFKYSYDIPGRSQKMEQAVLEITYENVYGDRWKIQSDKSIPEKLN